MLLGKGVLKVCSKYTGEYPYWSPISIKLLCNFIRVTLRHEDSPVRLLHIFRTPFLKSTSGWLLLSMLFNPFKVVEGLMGCVQSRGIGARAPLPPRFILLGGFGGTLLAVLILGMVCIVYDCHLWPVLQCWGGVINSSSVYYGFFLYWEWSFQFCGGAYGLCLKSRAQRTRLSYPAGKLQWHFTCGFKFRHSLWLPFVAGFAALKGLLIVSVGTMGYF